MLWKWFLHIPMECLVHDQPRRRKYGGQCSLRWELDELYEGKIPAWKVRGTSTLSDQSGHKNKTLKPGRPRRNLRYATFCRLNL